MSRPTTPTPADHEEVSTLCARHNLTMSKFALGWHVTAPLVGAVNGLPTLRGQLLLTDGMTCVVLRSDGSTFRAHYAWFVPDDATLSSLAPHRGGPLEGRLKAKRVLRDYIDM